MNSSGELHGKTTDPVGEETPERVSVTGYTPHQSTYLAHRITLEGRREDAFAKSLSTLVCMPSTAPAPHGLRGFRGREKRITLFCRDLADSDGNIRRFSYGHCSVG
jgi:hypothetical protein